MLSLVTTSGTCATNAQSVRKGVQSAPNHRPCSGTGRAVLRSTAYVCGRRLHGSCSNGYRWHAAQWLENSAQTDVNVPLEEAWKLWEDRERIPQWMPWITSVKVQPDDPRLSKWTLSTEQFGRSWEFSWLARNLTPIKDQKIHWRSVEGSTGGLEVPNRGQIRFYRKSPQACTVKLTISYEVPDPLAPFGNALIPIVENILRTDMNRFAKYAADHVRQQQQAGR
ncbi:hypothetical protein WJX72_002582 [[Myrmecia] bisecta]|uniref:Coenzyme Q-binding protein COQ10 START domain-containing protein n=1 Tax=[Myrmecia] bisecta TaxID=41462 RepID=A0AAW1PZX8_9CHLO